VGGITGAGNVANSSIDGPVKIDIATGTGTVLSVYAGGIAGYTAAGGISNVGVNGNIEMNISAKTTTGPVYAGGIAGCTAINGKISNISVNGDAEVSVTTISTTTGIVYAGGILGYTGSSGSGGISNAAITGKANVTVNPAATTTSGSVYAGGIGGHIQTGGISNAAITGGAKVTVTSVSATMTGGVWAGGITGYTTGAGGVSNASITGGANVTAASAYTGTAVTATTGPVYAGGIAGQTVGGAISRGSITGPSEIKVESTATGTVYAGGLVGSGIGVEYSFIGTKNEYAKVNVTKTNTTSLTNGNYAYVGGISGQAAPTSTLKFQYNYAFCDVTLTTTASSTSTNTSVGQFAGGLVGYISTSSNFNENFAAGSVTITDNSSVVGNRRILAGGIAGYSPSNGLLTQCAALNNSVVINGTSTAATTNVYRRRIAWTIAAQATVINASANNITTVTGTAPDNYTPTNGKANQDGYLVESPLTSENFFGNAATEGQLGWNTAVWEWNDSGYPVLK
jgi:hypothetical protein